MSAKITQGQSAPSSPPLQELRRQFQRPPDDARIMMRWWWFGPAVTNAELQRELETMKQGAIGGVEVQPVYPLALDDPQSGLKNLPYLSDAFLDSLRFASQKAKDLGLRFDLTLGSGWPWGGPSVPITEAAGMLRIVRKKLEISATRVPAPYVGPGEHLLAAFVAPAGSSANTLDSFTAVPIRDGVVELPASKGGNREVLFFISSRTAQQVKRAAVGAEGFVVDHYDRAAVQNYLHSVGDRLMQAFQTEPPFSVFCDSLEVYNSDWTADFLQEFQLRRGYDLKPYMPALIADVGPKTLDIRYDWARTLSELFNERFAATSHDWALRNHTRLRMQAYGIPPAELSSSRDVDLPEGEGAQWRTLSATRWASSASHLYGVPVTSSETWTWLHSPAFRASPLDMKAEADRHFLSGVNQLIGHGWPYSPPGVEDPGWRFYAAAVFDEKNPWWIVMPDVARYLQRLSFILRQGRPVNNIALYLPTSDGWAHMTPGHVNLFETLRERIGSRVIEGILNAGFNFDVFDDDTLRHLGHIEKSALVIGPNTYRIVILPGVERIPLDTYQKIEALVRAGGIVIATQRLPTTTPGFGTPSMERALGTEISRRLFEGAAAPAKFVSDEAQLASRLTALVASDVSFSPRAPEVGVVHRRLSDGDIYFLANTGNVSQKTTATFRVSATHAEWWDPLSGTITPAKLASVADRQSLEVELEPYGSRILVFSSESLPASQAAQPISNSSSLDISQGWTVKFGREDNAVLMDHLRSWTDDEKTRYFSGTARYEKTVAISPESISRASSVWLDFGEGKPLPQEPLRSGVQAWLDAPIREAAVIYVNDQRAGSIWCPPYRLEIGSYLHAGANTLRIVVANLALNAMASRPLPDYRLLNSRYGTRFEPQDMDKVQPVAAGILGRVRLMFGAKQQ